MSRGYFYIGGVNTLYSFGGIGMYRGRTCGATGGDHGSFGGALFNFTRGGVIGAR